MKKPFLAALFALPVLIFGGTAVFSRADNAPRAPKIEVVGPSVLLNAQGVETPLVYDLRATGRAVPNARKLPENPQNGAFWIGEISHAARLIEKHKIQSAQIIPPRLIEFAHEKGVPQIAPRDAKKRQTQKRAWPLFDISEQSEFESFAIPNSRRLDFADFRAGKWADLPRNSPFIVACRVGHRSQIVVKELRKSGYNAHNLDGGLWAWEVEGLELRR